MDTTALIGISTPPSDPDNYYSRLFDLQGLDGKPMFHVVTVEYDPNASTDEISRWKSAEKIELIQMLYAMRKGDYEREMLGSRTVENDSVFSGAWIKQFLDYRRDPSVDVRRIYTGIDPNGGGSSTMCAISVCLDRGTFVVLSVTTKEAKNADDVRDAMHEHIQGLRDTKGCRNADILLFPENNLAHEASHIEYHVRNMRRVSVFQETPGRAGVCTTNRRKALYVQNLQAVLSLGQLALGTGVGEETETLGAQLRQFSRYFSKTGTCTYTGKERGNDDAAMALLIAVHWAKQVEMGKVMEVKN